MEGVCEWRGGCEWGMGVEESERGRWWRRKKKKMTTTSCACRGHNNTAQSVSSAGNCPVDYNPTSERSVNNKPEIDYFMNSKSLSDE